MIIHSGHLERHFPTNKLPKTLHNITLHLRYGGGTLKLTLWCQFFYSSVYKLATSVGTKLDQVTV